MEFREIHSRREDVCKQFDCCFPYDGFLISLVNISVFIHSVNTLLLTERSGRHTVIQLCPALTMAFLDNIDVRRARQSPAQRTPVSLECMSAVVRLSHLVKLGDASKLSFKLDSIVGRFSTA